MATMFKAVCPGVSGTQSDPTWDTGATFYKTTQNNLIDAGAHNG